MTGTQDSGPLQLELSTFIYAGAAKVVCQKVYVACAVWHTLNTTRATHTRLADWLPWLCLSVGAWQLRRRLELAKLSVWQLKVIWLNVCRQFELAADTVTHTHTQAHTYVLSHVAKTQHKFLERCTQLKTDSPNLCCPSLYSSISTLLSILFVCPPWVT